MNLHVSLWFVPGDETPATQSPMVCILPNMTRHGSLQVFPDDEFLPHRAHSHEMSHRFWSFKIMNLYLSPYAVSGDKFLATHSTAIWIVPSMFLFVSLYVVPGDKTLHTEHIDMDSPHYDSLCVCSDSC